MDDPRPVTEGLAASLARIEQRLHGQPVPAPVPPPADVRPVLPVDDRPPPSPGDQELAFTPRLFAQLALPYRNPGPIPEWVRRNGGRELIVTPGRVLDPATATTRPGYPYGVVPRLVVIWLTGEVLKHHQRELSLGPSLGGFLGRMGLTRSGTQAARVRDQVTRLFAATVTVTATAQCGPVTGWAMDSVRVARKARLWWQHEEASGDPFWMSSVTLSEEFYEAIEEWAIPLDAAALAALRATTRSPMALDIYAWLADRLWRVDGSTPPLRWGDLALQFGGDYGEVRMFKRQFLKDLNHVLTVYPAARVEPGPRGLVLRRSPAPVQPKALGRR